MCPTRRRRIDLARGRGSRLGDAMLVKGSNSIGLAALVESAGEREELMFLWIAEQLGYPGLLNLFRYITFRAGAAPPRPR